MQIRTLPAILALLGPLALGACVSDGGGAASGGLAGSGASSGSGSGSGSELGSRSASSTATRELVGKSESDVRSELGAPAFKRTDGPAQVWQYRGASCLLDVFLYKEGGGGFRVKHAELRRRGGAGLSDSACLSDAVSNRARS